MYSSSAFDGNTTTKIYGFGIGPTTVCKLRKNGTIISPQDALEGARYGWYECWLSLPSSGRAAASNAVAGVSTQERTAVYRRNNGTIVAALGTTGLFVALVALFGK